MADPSSLIHPSKSPPQKSQQNPTTPFPSFIYKAVFVGVLVALLPILPPRSPELPNRTILARAWELLHLLLVGIAISYGLFSRRNSDHDVAVDKEAHSHVSSVFEEDEEGPELPDETKTQTWSYSQYNPVEPAFVVAEESSATADAKTLLLPVRSLKSTQRDEDGDGDGRKAGAVLPSPVPWRSRSGRTEAKEPPPSPPVSAAEAELGPSVSPEIRAEIGEGSGRKKSFYESSPPPAPPPPPLPLVHGHGIATEKKDGRRSFKYELEHLSMRGRDELGLDPPGPDSGRDKEVRRSRTLPTRRSRKKKKKNEFRERMIIDSSDSDAESETSDVGDELTVNSGPAWPEENEVDKKADEFIAKFREQIRLQRIKKRSTAAQRNVTSPA